MRAFSYGARVYFWSRDKDGGHIIRSVITENPMLHANFMAQSFTLGMRAMQLFLLLWP